MFLDSKFDRTAFQLVQLHGQNPIDLNPMDLSSSDLNHTDQNLIDLNLIDLYQEKKVSSPSIRRKSILSISKVEIRLYFLETEKKIFKL